MIAVFTREGATEFRKRLKQRFRMRALEWEHAIMTTLWGFIVLANPGIFDGPAFRAWIFSIPGPVAWGWSVLLLGIARLLALAINGYMAQPTAIVRTFAAATGIALFAAMSAGLALSGTGPTGLATYPVIAVFGIFSVFWAVIDVGVPDHHEP